jgi:hypothetical protein
MRLVVDVAFVVAVRRGATPHAIASRKTGIDTASKKLQARSDKIRWDYPAP